MNTHGASQCPEHRHRQIKFGNRSRRRWRSVRVLVVVALLFAALIPMAAGAATTQPQPGVSQRTNQPAAAQEVQQDAGLIAEEYDVSVETVLNRLQHEEVVAGLIAEWAAVYPNGYAGAYHADGFVAASVVMWVGTVPRAVSAQAAPHGVSLSFDTSSPISANAYDQLARDAAALLASTGHSEAIVEPSPKTKSLDVIVRGDDSAAPRLDATRLSLKTLLPVGVTSNVTERDGQLVDSATRTFHGGAKIHDANRSSRYCTSAFAVTRAQDDGLITAGHCTRMTRYKIPLDGRVRTLTEEGLHLGSQGDIGWYSFSGTPSPIFYIGDGRYDTRTLTGMRRESGFSTNQRVCFYGRASNERDCGSLKAWNLCITYSGATVCNIARVTLDDVQVQEGDSGGPWYIGSTAVGITAARVSGSTTAYFTPVEAALNRYGLDLVYG